MIKQIYHQHKGRFGYRRITLTMRDKGIIINHKTVLRLMKSLGLKSIIRVKKYKSYRGEPVSYTHLDVYKRQVWMLPIKVREFTTSIRIRFTLATN